MSLQNTALSSVAINKVKYEISVFDLNIMKSRVYARYVIKGTGELTETLYEPNQDKSIKKSKVSTDSVKTFFSSLAACIFSDTSIHEPTIDDTARKITLYFDDGTSQKFDGLYGNDSADSDQLITDFFR